MRRRTERATGTLLAIVAALAVGCASDAGAPGSGRSGADEAGVAPDDGASDDGAPEDGAASDGQDDLMTSLRDAMVTAGEEERAALLDDEATRVAELDAPFLATFDLLQVTAPTSGAPALFHVGFDGSEAIVVTGRPDAFEELLARDGGAIGDDEAAVAAARAYAETTRPSDRFGRVVETVTDVRLRGSLDDGEREEAVSELEPLVGAPEVVAEEAGRYTVALTYLDGDVLERREVTLGGGGPVEVDRQVLADGLPVPASL